MRTSVVLTLLLVVFAAWAESPGVSQPVKLYYGLPGSDDFVWGWAGPEQPTDVWAQHSLMPQMLMDNAACADANNAYVVSGYNASNPKFLFKHAKGATTWTTLAAPPIEISNGGIAAVGDTLFYCSGYSYGTGASLDTLLKYSISGNTWSAGPGPFTGTTYNWQPLILAAGGKVYYISGCNQPGATSPSRQVWAYTPGAGWARKKDMNTGSVFAAGWVYKDTIWVAGGNANNVGITRTEFYPVAQDTWIINNSVFPQLPEALWGVSASCVPAAKKAYVAGGVTTAGALTDTVYYFDHATRTWSVGGQLPTRIYRGAAAGNADGRAVVYGGSTGGFTPTNICQYDSLPIQPSQLRVLWLYADFGTPETTLGVRLKALGDSIVYMDVQNATPTLAQLMPYDAVGAHSNYAYFNPTALGDTLAAYVAAGHGAVIAASSFTSGWNMAGGIMAGNNATIGLGNNSQSATTLGWNRGSHPIMSGVTSVNEWLGAAAGFVTTDSVAKWTDGRAYVGVSANQKVAGINQYPGIHADPRRSGDWALVIHNALHYVAGMTGVKLDPLAPAMHIELGTAPNPAHRQVNVNYMVRAGANVRVDVFGLDGRLVRSLYSGSAGEGVHRLTWDMTDGSGHRVANGTYFCKLVADGKSQMRKVVVQ